MPHQDAPPSTDPLTPAEAAAGLRRGDFSRLAPLFGDPATPEAATGPMVAWLEAGTFTEQPDVLAEALTCACWLGQVGVARRLLDHGVDAAAGTGTGLGALHWAANRGQRAAVELLVAWGAPVEQRSVYDATALGAAVWAACHEPRGDQLGVIRTLLAAGADPHATAYPTGHAAVDEVLGRARAVGARASGARPASPAADRVVPMLHVPDVRAAVAWYAAVGFALRASHEACGALTWAALTLGASEVMLSAGGRPANAPRRDADLYVHTRGVDALYRKLPAGVAVVEAPHDTEYGQRECIVRDLNGFWLTFGEPIVAS